MTSFISIFKYGDGMASYHVSGSRYQQYTAQLVRSTTQHQLPQHLTIDVTPTRQPQSEDPLMEKLVAAINKAEATGEDIP